ncbi:MAG TPA: UDP-N-acetylglucosamine 2-epimerase (non-hydrolyzing) [Candidatus Binatia bacterium]|nr:UDP-N-acetylglucosamine 2-epimerase (non-hydrolyzing) [Candidatus Binatia bacterium]
MVILTVLGARPQFIKAKPVSAALADAGLREILLHTDQHYDDNMSGVFFRELGLRTPDIHLGVGSGSHGEQTGAMLIGVEKAILQHKPDWTLIYGDTNSTLAGALAASKLNVPVAHVEAGLRSFNLGMPEEINRIVADRLSLLLFAPTPAACENLCREGHPENRVHCVGDVMFDAILAFRETVLRSSKALTDLQLAPKSYFLATIHRAENTDRPARLRAIVDGLNLVAQTLPGVLPLHPRTRRAVQKLGLAFSPNLRVIEPLGFLDMQRLEMEARMIATDSGGVQKEAFWHRVPCVTLRDETEWVELVEAGANQLCPPADPRRICAHLLEASQRQVQSAPLYGNGTAAKQIAALLRASSEPRSGDAK